MDKYGVVFWNLHEGDEPIRLWMYAKDVEAAQQKVKGLSIPGYVRGYSVAKLTQADVDFTQKLENYFGLS